MVGSDTGLLGLLVVLLAALLAAVLVLCFLQVRRAATGGDLGAPLLHLSQAVQAAQAQTSLLAEKLAHLESTPQLVTGMRLELRSLVERVSTVDQAQQRAQLGITDLGMGMTETGTIAHGLADATAAIREDLARAKNDLTEIQTLAKARHDVEERSAESIRRLEAIIAGTQSKGAAGENILEAAFARLPPEWRVRDFRVGNKVVEFGLRLPNHLVLPIDSKWAATDLLEAFVGCDDPVEQARLKGQIESVVLGKAREVQKYLHPSLTVSFGVAAVPDAIYDLCGGAHAEALQLNVVLISYSMFLPYLLLVFQTTLKTSQSIDVEKLEAHLQRAQASTQAAQCVLEGHFARALTMLGNSREELRRQLSSVSSSLTSLQRGAGAPESTVPPLFPGDSEPSGG